MKCVKTLSHRAIVDIGSNSVRLVIFGGPARAPIILHNEKVVAGLGRGVIADGQLTRDACDMALEGLRRFALTIKAMNAVPIDVVATAAVRNAANGEAFVQEVRALGLPVRILSGEEEAVASAMGVISGNPLANGLVADLGGGSLELVRVSGGAALQRTSLPIGILNVAAIRAEGKTALRKRIATLVRPYEWLKGDSGLPLHLVGGSWRALARIHRQRAGADAWPLDQYSFATQDVAGLARMIARSDKAQLRAIPGMPAGRVSMVDDACALLSALVSVLAPSDLVTCAFGLREGLLYQALDKETRALDPLIEAVRFATGPTQPVPGQADALMGWLNGLFDDEPSSIARLRHAACLIAGQGWLIGPEARAADGAAMALHGKWIGITVRERAMVAVAVQVAAGDDEAGSMSVAPLVSAADAQRARQWGQAMRLAGRLAGGAPSVLQRSRAELCEGQLLISLPQDLAVLGNAAFQRRAGALAASWGLAGARIRIN